MLSSIMSLQKTSVMKNKSSLNRGDFKPAKIPNTPNSVVAPVRNVTHGQISTRAQMIWEQRGRPYGVDDEIWLEAEQQLGVRQGELHDSDQDIEDANKLEERLGDTGEQTNPRSSTSL
jgi:hypothetical protein